MISPKEENMGKESRLFLFLSLSVFMVIAAVCPVGAQDNKVRAKIGIGIKSGDQTKSAKSQDDINVSDFIRVYVHPEEPSYVYVIHTDEKKSTLLYKPQQKSQGSTLAMPSAKDFYQVDGASPKEAFSIIVSPTALTEVKNVFKNGTASIDDWTAVEESLLAKSKIDLGEDVEKPFAIAGNVRGTDAKNADPFINNLEIFSGKSLLVKKYEFRVKK
jgi:hypothetical protein